jgi:hypothetical protein
MQNVFVCTLRHGALFKQQLAVVSTWRVDVGALGEQQLDHLLITYAAKAAEFGLGTAHTKSTHIDLATVLPIPIL